MYIPFVSDVFAPEVTPAQKARYMLYGAAIGFVLGLVVMR